MMEQHLLDTRGVESPSHLFLCSGDRIFVTEEMAKIYHSKT